MADNLVIDRRAIGCDCCGKLAPPKSCSGCRSYYYCDRNCQVTHWKEHKKQCSFLKGKCDRFMKEKGAECKVTDESDSSKGPCAICLEDEIEFPIVLECGHVFCVNCLINYQTKNFFKVGCPNCREAMKDVSLKAVDHLKVYTDRAKKSQGNERDVYVNLALRLIDATLNDQSLFESQKYKDAMELSACLSKIMVFRDLGMYREVVDTADGFMHLCANTEFNEHVEWIVEVRMHKAEAHGKLEEWQTSLRLYQALFEDCREQHLQYCATILPGISRAHYEMHDYHEAIVEGCRVHWRENQYRAGVHKYVALSQMKTGDMAGAKKSITKAILYEEQWNTENLKENKEVLRMILAEEEQVAKPKSKKKQGKKKGKGKK